MEIRGVAPAIDLAQSSATRFSRLQVLVVSLCGIAAILEGFDMITIAFAARSMARALHYDIASFGPVFGMGAIGLMVGSLVMGRLADKWGRKPVIVIAMLMIGFFTGLTPFTRTFHQLLVIRLLAGVGFGALTPNIIALTSEYSPPRWTARMVTVMACGLTVGAIFAGALFDPIVGIWSWQGMFYVGAILPLLMIPLFIVYLPESRAFLAARGTGRGRSPAHLRQEHPIDARLTSADVKPPAAKTGIGGLFADQRALITPLLWLTFFCNLLVWFFLMNWLPAILELAGFPPARATTFTVLLYVGGFIGGLMLGWMVDRWMSFTRLAGIYVLAAISVYLTGVFAQVANPLFYVACFLAGFFVCGALYAINAVAARLYPTEVRSTGLGWALGIGRLGSILGPTLGGLLIGLHWSSDKLMGLMGLPALVAAIAIAIIGLEMKRHGKQL
ncbi:MFS transporter [Burkholderia anthina]|uniref:MFS transporter n=1 Tax=Burkholderia anthina TaxID=179879 RepID=UPI00158EF73F|nr:MFS transporter [Burkholderia anthina]